MPDSDRLQLDAAAHARAQALTALLRDEIDAAGGWIPFERFMQQALYAPQLGYYSAGAVKLGAGGDFTTAPELSAVFADAIAGFVMPQLRDLAEPVFLELGAGTGRFAARMLEQFAAAGLGAVRYAILEPSPDLRSRQQALLEPCGDRVQWLDRLPAEPIQGIVFGNEVADALPVQLFEKVAGRTLPLGVTCRDGEFAWAHGAPDARLTAAVARIAALRGAEFADGYRSEVCLLLEPWLASLADCIARGSVLLVDYGYPAREYYHAERSGGTLICHHRHRAHADPFVAPGTQDISAWVDFSALARAGRDCGLEVLGYTTQAQFLAGYLAGLPAAEIEALGAAGQSALKTLLLPGEMGERFKVVWLGRDSAAYELPGRDMRRWL